jgi:hypothetical protein
VTRYQPALIFSDGEWDMTRRSRRASNCWPDTKKPGALDAITPGWPGKELILRNIRVPADATVTMLGVPGKLNHRVEGSTLAITMPDLGPEQALCRHAYSLKISGAELPPE